VHSCLSFGVFREHVGLVEFGLASVGLALRRRFAASKGNDTSGIPAEQDKDAVKTKKDAAKDSLAAIRTCGNRLLS
jgi:hypothetical protein